MPFQKIIKFYILGLLLAAISTPTQACSCEGWPQPFCNATNEQSVVSLIRIIDKPEYYLMHVEIIEEINLEMIKDTILVVGQDGLNCGEDLDLFSIGDTLVVSLFFVDNEPFFHEADYSLGGCDIQYLRYQNGQVMGNPYATFLENFQDCLDMVLSDDPVEADKTLDVYPTLVDNQLNLDCSSAPIEQVQIYSLSGNRLLEQRGIRQQQISLSLNHLSAGIYIVRIKIGKHWLNRKIVKQ